MHALVTGASGGLGQAFCEHLAEQGHDVVLVSRRTDELERIAAGLRERYGVQTVVLGADLSEESVRNDLAADLRARGIQVDVLVNNAGFGTIGDFVEADVDRMNDEVGLNCAAVVHLCRLLLPGMLERGRGSIVNVASTAAFQPIPTMAVYAATKAFVLSFTHALWEETRDTPVRVTAICPGPTDTPFFDSAGDDKVLSRRRTPQQVVASTFKALERRAPSVTDGLLNAVQGQVARHSPVRIAVPVARRVVRPTGRK